MKLDEKLVNIKDMITFYEKINSTLLESNMGHLETIIILEKAKENYILHNFGGEDIDRYRDLMGFNDKNGGKNE